MGFYKSYDPTNSVKALKEVVVLRIGFNLTRSTSPCYNATHACNNTYTKMNLKQSEMGPVRQNPIQRTVSSVDMCVHWSVHNCCAQYCTEQTWQFSLLPSRQSPLLWWCLFEGRGDTLLRKWCPNKKHFTELDLQHGGKTAGIDMI